LGDARLGAARAASEQQDECDKENECSAQP
jgi:hypothetical protein